MGWLGHGAGVGYNVMRLLRGKGSLLAVQPEAVAGDSNSVDVVTAKILGDTYHRQVPLPRISNNQAQDSTRDLAQP